MALPGSRLNGICSGPAKMGLSTLMEYLKIAIRLKSYRSVLDLSKVPTLHEDELEEQFMRGSGPGGQATNKTNNAVLLKHKPSGLVVRCHETRSQEINRKRARELMLKKLDNLINADDSLESQERRLREKDNKKAVGKKRKLAELKRKFIEREGFADPPDQC